MVNNVRWCDSTLATGAIDCEVSEDNDHHNRKYSRNNETNNNHNINNAAAWQ